MPRDDWNVDSLLRRNYVDFVVDEGVRPKTPFELRAAMIRDLAAQYPGAVYKVSGRKPDERNTAEAWAPLHLPREGNGVFYVIYDNMLTAAKVYDIAWKAYSAVLIHRGEDVPEKPKPSNFRLAFPPST